MYLTTCLAKMLLSKPIVEHKLCTRNIFFSLVLFLVYSSWPLNGNWIFFVIDQKHFSSPLCSNLFLKTQVAITAFVGVTPLIGEW